MGEGAVYTVSLSEPLWWKKIGKVANWAKLAIPSHSEPLRWEKIGKVATQTKSNFPYIVWGRWGLSSSTSPAENQKLNVIQK